MSGCWRFITWLRRPATDLKILSETLKPRLARLLLACLLPLLILGCGDGEVAAPPPTPAETPVESAGDTDADDAIATSPAPEEQAPAAAPETPSNQATLYRDKWGVPHIYAGSEPAAGYAMGYAQAQDRLADIHRNVRIATGRMAEAFGKEYVDQDYLILLARNPEVSKAWWDKAGAENLKELCSAFIAGVEAYSSEHPEDKPEFALELEPWHCIAIGRTISLKWPIGTLLDDLDKRQEDPGFGSNAWALAPSRTTDNVAMLMTDVHQTWSDIELFYEGRIHAGNLDIRGFFLVGGPLMAFGHNKHVGWAPTTGGPDTSDVYMLKLDPTKNPIPVYEYEGEWIQPEIRVITIPVKDAEPVQRPAAYTRFGPLLSEPDWEHGVAYAGASPYFDSDGLAEQMYAMATANNIEELYAALGMLQFPEQNMILADTGGHIQYVRQGRTPVRPAGYEWNAPVPGNTSATAWTGIHDIADLVQVSDPAAGWLMNCNTSPAYATADSPLTADKYASYIYNVSWDDQNSRGLRAIELLSGEAKITVEQAQSMATDVHEVYSEIWQNALRDPRVVEKAGDDESVKKAINMILEWNGDYMIDSMGATLMKEWRTQTQADKRAINAGAAITDEMAQALAEGLVAAVKSMQEKHGTIEVPWGQIHVVGRAGRYFPAPGAEYGNLFRTLFNVAVQPSPEAENKEVAFRGSMATTLMVFRPEGVESFTLTPWGQSGHESSPHFMDQGEMLYSQRQFKPTWFAKEALLANLESELVLTLP